MMRQTKAPLSAGFLVSYTATAIWMLMGGQAFAAETATSASSDLTLEEIVVTAAKREESMQKVPISITALKGSDLQKLGANSLNDYVKFVPGVNFAPTATGDRGGQNIIIRGVSNTRMTGVDSAASASTTSFYLNDIPVTLIDPLLFDINRVEILKGPQGTLFGAASMGGTVRIIMNQADSTRWAANVEGTLQTTAGGIGNRINGMINIPLVENVLAARVVVYHHFDPGYISVIVPPLTDTSSNLAPNIPGFNVVQSQNGTNLRKNSNTHQSDGARLTFSFTPNENFKLEPTVVYQKTKVADQDTFDANMHAGFLKKRFVPEPQSQSFFLSSLEGSYDFGPVKLYSATGYFERHYGESIDESLGTYKIYGGTPSGALAGVGALGTNIDTKSFTQEIRLQSTGKSDNDFINRFDWIIGAYYSEETRNGNQLWMIPGFNANALTPITTNNDVVFTSVWNAKDKNKSVFGDLAFHVTKKFKVSAGLRRYDQTQRIYRDLMGPLQGATYALTPQHTYVSAASKGVTPRYTASFQATNDLLIYASAAKGFRAGGGVVPATEPNCIDVIQQQHLESFNGSFGPDKLWQYEGGFKSTWADGRLQLNSSAYLIKWSALQQSIALGQFFNSTCSKNLTGNVGEAEIKGVEAEIKAIPVRNLLVQGSISYSRARISEVDPKSKIGYVGAQLQNVPDWTGMASIEYSFPHIFDDGQGYIRADYAYRSSVTTVVGVPVNPLLALPAYSNVNFRAGVNWRDIKVETFIENAFNSVQLLSAGAGTGTAISQVANRPRTVGITVGKKF